MGILSRFRKRKPEDVYRSITQRIVTVSLRYRRDLYQGELLKPANNEAATDAGAEMASVLYILTP